MRRRAREKTEILDCDTKMRKKKRKDEEQCCYLSSDLRHHGQIYASRKRRGPESIPTGSVVDRWSEN